MDLPTFDPDGNLPVAVYLLSLNEVRRQLGSTGRRAALMARLERIYAHARATGCLRRFIVYGSFVTAKVNPGDVDVFLIMEDSFDLSQVIGEAKIVFDHSAADSHFGCSIFWVRRFAAFGGEQKAVEFWQNCRGGGVRGIIEIVEDRP
jgi:hypothetical protein